MAIAKDVKFFFLFLFLAIIPKTGESSKDSFMTIKRIILSVLTVLAILLAGVSLWESWQQPQIQSRLELYQTNLLLQASQWQPQESEGKNLSAARDALVGDKPLAAAAEQYQAARDSAVKNLDKAQAQLKELRSQPISTPATPKPQSEIAPATDTSRLRQQQLLQKSIDQLEKVIAELDLRLGILQAQQEQTDKALKTWGNVGGQGDKETRRQGDKGKLATELDQTANVLIGLWSNPARLLPDAQQLIQANLDGWFRDRALSQLYQLQQRQAALEELQAAKQASAEQALLKLAIIGSIPAVTGLTGIGLIIFLVGQRLSKGKESLLARNEDTAWSTPWTGETVWQVFIVGFFLMGQLLIPVALTILNVKPAAGNLRQQAFYVLANYLFLAGGGLGVLYLSIKPFFPLPADWFRLNLRGFWWLWGLGGYCVALPLVVVISIINQQLWQGQGGSNPLLSLALESQDSVALSIFFFTAAIAAPFFEEFLFRGFLLPSLTRYLPVWGAIVVSALLFAIAHLSLSEILPLATLGIVLGVVYTRSRNLLSSMLLHSLWNSGTLLSLFILGSSSS